MNIDLKNNEVQQVFEDLSPLILEVVDKYSKNADQLIHKMKKANTFTNDELRDLILELSIESYMFGMSRDASLLKQDCAITLMKQKQAEIYNNTQGTQAVRQNQSIVDSAEQQVVNMLYSAVANMMRTKHDELHRSLNTLNSILISRNAEAKLTAGNPTLNERLAEQLDNEQNIY